MASRSPGRSARPPRVVIEGLAPEVDAGRHPAKRLEGDTLRVGVDVYKDGHDLVDGRLLLLPPGEERWRAVPLVYDYAPDRWFGSAVLDRLGRWAYTVEAWPDRWGTWCRDLRRWLDVGEPVETQLLEGAALLRRAAGVAGRTASEAAARLGDAARPVAERVSTALSDELAKALAGPLEERELTRYPRTPELVVDRERAGFAAWYEMFPRSQTSEPARHGTFDDAARRLPELAELGFDVVYLPPIHPIGRTHRKGRNNRRRAEPGDVGSPWAIGAVEGGHDAVHPELGGLEAFERFRARAEGLGLEVALDFALQCSPDHPWVREHPEWFVRRPDGSIHYAENPPKRYEDIYPLDFWCEDREALWEACKHLLLFWVERGVRTFRVDNPHTKPFAFWEWAIGEVKARHPDVVFLSEAFTRPKRMKGLAKLGFTQSYTYFTWKNRSWELREYLSELTDTEMVEYYRPNFFANTPDILHEYLQTGGRPAFRVRLLLAATLSPLYGIYSGFELCENEAVREGSEEYLDSEKYQLRPRDWEAPGNIKEDIRRLNAVRREHPALRRLANLRFLHSDNDNVLAYWKSAPEDDLVVAVNLDPHAVQETMVQVPVEALGIGRDEPYEVHDLLADVRYVWRGERNYVRLDPGDNVGHLLHVRRGAAGRG